MTPTLLHFLLMFRYLGKSGYVDVSISKIIP